MANDIDLIAESRDKSGTSHSRRMRHAGMVPAVIYGAEKETLNLAIDHNQLLRKLANESFLNSILNIKIDDKEESVLIKNVQVHPSKRQIIHLDLQRVESDVVIRVSIPLQFLNEDMAEGVKLEGGTVTPLMNEIEVSCLPKDLPEKLEVDVIDLKLDDMLYLEDIVLPEGVEILSDPESTIATLAPPKEEEEPVVEDLEEGEELLEGEEPADGEAPSTEEGSAETKEGDEQGGKQDDSSDGSD